MKRYSLLLVLTLGSLFYLVPSISFADDSKIHWTLDARLIDKVSLIRGEIERKDCKNVAVLPFRFQKGNSPASFNVGTINTSIVTRLENALVMSNTDESSTKINVLTDVNEVAAGKIGSWFTLASQRRKLFTLDYPLIWDQKKKMKPDIFLTGIIKLSEKLDTTTVEFEYFLAKDKDVKIQTLDVKFEFPTDRSLLRDAGESFIVSKSKILKASPKERDKLALYSVRRRDAGETDPDGIAGVPTDFGGIRIEILYDDVLQTIRKETGRGGLGEYCVDTPKEGQKVAIRLVHTKQKSEPIYTVLRVNGDSVWQQERLDPAECRKWYMDAEKYHTYTFRGFSEDKTREIPWKVLSDAESEQRVADFGEKGGYIDLDLFVERAKNEPAEEMTISTYGIARRDIAKTPIKSRVDLEQRLWKSSGYKKPSGIAKYGLLVPDMTSPHHPQMIEQMDKVPMVREGGITIRYYSRKSSSSMDLEISKD